MNFSENFEQTNWVNSVHGDEFSSCDYKRLFSLLEAIYADAVACEVGKLAKERCCGCEYDHPSQRQHVCLMLSEQEKWQSYRLEAIERVRKMKTIRVMKLQYHKDLRQFREKSDSTFVYSLMDLLENTEDSEFGSILNYLSYWREDKLSDELSNWKEDCRDDLLGHGAVIYSVLFIMYSVDLHVCNYSINASVIK